ncbi:hypothetical protein C8R43DRAFT_1007765, partial [Mycena crocata]
MVFLLILLVSVSWLPKHITLPRLPKTSSGSSFTRFYVAFTLPFSVHSSMLPDISSARRSIFQQFFRPFSHLHACRELGNVLGNRGMAELAVT